MVPMVEFSTGTSWASVAKGYAALSYPRIRTDQVQSILPSVQGNSRMATIQMLVQRLHNEVRYTGVEFDKAQIVPQQPALVLKRHYGDCKDKATLLNCMMHAFHFSGGVTATVLTDNMKTVVLDRIERQPRFHPKMLDFASYYGFVPRVCHPYRPETKSKIESTIRYIKSSFWRGFSSTRWRS
ncbi:MAG: hypothetical protein ACLQMO_15530 [Acidobacteriaceae bacterium]